MSAAHPVKVPRTSGPVNDDLKVKRAALSVGLYVAFTSALVILLMIAVLIIVVVRRSVHYPGPGGGSDWPRNGPGWAPLPWAPNTYLIDRDQVVMWLVILGVVGVIALGTVAWLTARRAITPLAEALRLQRHFVADASHELRTPLTVLNARIQLLQRHLAKGQDSAPTIAALREDTARMNAVLDDLLLSVEGTSAPGEAVSQAGVAAREAVASLSVSADQAQVSLETDITTTSRVAVPPGSLVRAVVALTDNAIQHSPSGGTVRVQVADEGDQVVIRVTDQGSGIAAADTARIFERFAHGPERGRKRSFGLGLALVSDIAQRFGGDITVAQTGADGTVFRLSFPRLAELSS